jgi:hypothetical protein
MQRCNSRCVLTTAFILGFAPSGHAFAQAYPCALVQLSFSTSVDSGTTSDVIQSFSVPPAVTFLTIDVAGAQGGSGSAGGGPGSEVVADIPVTEGDTLCLLVGVRGGTGPYGGGGGGEIYGGLPGTVPTGAGTAGASAGRAGDQNGPSGGTGGNGGNTVFNSGGGGGLNTNGQSHGVNNNTMQGGRALINNAGGGNDTTFHWGNGGFGGGGASLNVGGGGGGYNGGGAGTFMPNNGGGGGGGSYSVTEPLAPYTQAGARGGNGAITLCYVDRIFADAFE